MSKKRLLIIDQSWERLRRWLYRNPGADWRRTLASAEGRGMIQATFGMLRRGLAQTVRIQTEPRLSEKLLRDVFHFSGFKTIQMARQAQRIMLNPDGTLKGFDRYEYEVHKKMDSSYNRTYLQAEYNLAVLSGQAAQKWEDWRGSDVTRYNLQWRTALDSKVRPTHRPLEGITLPMDSPFWNRYFPPLGWNCRCDVVRVLKSKYPQSDLWRARQVAEAALIKASGKDGRHAHLFCYNPGKAGIVFPPGHPYYKAFGKEDRGKVKGALDGMLAETLEAHDYARSLSPEVKGNIAAVAESVGVAAGEPMPRDLADLGNANPRRGEPGYNRNSVECVIAYMMRLRGLDVAAGPNNETPGSLPYRASMLPPGCFWSNADGSPCHTTLFARWSEENGHDGQMSDLLYLEAVNEICSEPGVYQITIGYRNGSSHTAILQRKSDGRLVYIEPQGIMKGLEHKVEELLCECAARPTAIHGIVRIDDKLLSAEFFPLIAPKRP